MVYHPFYPAIDLCRLICGVIEIISAFFAILKVSEGSKNKFAYTLLSFTVITGISYVGQPLDEAFRHEVIQPNRTYYFNNKYAILTFAYLQYIAGLQGWIFGICYFKSATASSFSVFWLTESKINVFGWVIGIIYFVYQTIALIVLLATFPGYYDENGVTQQFLKWSDVTAPKFEKQ